MRRELHTFPSSSACNVATIARSGWVALALTGCAGPQSTLEPAGRAAGRIAELFWGMTAGAVVIWIAVVGLAAYAVYRTRERGEFKEGRLLIVGGGVIVPTIVLTALLVHGLAMLPSILAAAPDGSLKIQVSGEQWWWRVRYFGPDGETIDLANEIRLPVGTPVDFELSSPDVIHSFWIPALGGKMDMIPGRTTRLLLEPIRTGRFRGVCAEYCGGSHAYMMFEVVVSEREPFDRWLAQQATPAVRAAGGDAARGEELFAAYGCGACHTIRGTDADGVVGPDLTHVGSRLSLGAGRLGNEPGDFARFIARTDHLKPAVLMPHFGMLAEDDLRALAAYLEGLQ